MIRHNVLSDSNAAALYIAGVHKLKDPALSPWPGREGLSIYDFFVFWHHRAMMLPTPPTQNVRNAAHSGPVFLPWHRYMLLRLEALMRQALDNDDFRIPYWDWAADAELVDPKRSALWQHDLLGQFVGPVWKVRLEANPTGRNPRIISDGRPLRRALGVELSLPSRRMVRDVLTNEMIYDVPTYDSSVMGLRNRIEGWINAQGSAEAVLHNRVHVWIGGDMGSSTSPNDPAFFLHHANVDRIWSAWRQRHPNAPYRPPQTEAEPLLFHRIDDPMHTFFDERVTPRMMLDHSAEYQYDTLDDLMAS